MLCLPPGCNSSDQQGLLVSQIKQNNQTSLKYTPNGGASTPINYGDAANAITKLRDTLAGTSAESPIEQVYAADGNAIAYSRTPSQVCVCPPG